MMAASDAFMRIISQPRYAPAYLSAFLAGLLLLFVGDLPEPTRRYFLPGLIIYSLGAGLLASLHRLAALSYFAASGQQHSDEAAIPLLGRIAIWSLHAAWLVCLVGYCIYRGAL